ncbi:MAG: S-adenosylmethionine:tRNA ribosyltransferase-isomerase [Bryobacterales bacterium]|nr:S-adenosylmethionine:tRNA ribosyltransferase-isomerase [Bryobacterales bacterium]
MLEACRARGAETARLTLHVGLGTFAPLRAERVEDVKLHAEWFDLRADEAAKLAAARRRVAVGTTSVRTLETVLARIGGEFRALSGDTDIFISPGFSFQATGALLTNFHLPQSSLLMLVCALAGRELTLAAYRHAVEARYRFYSYGDCMLIV